MNIILLFDLFEVENSTLLICLICVLTVFPDGTFDFDFKCPDKFILSLLSCLKCLDCFVFVDCCF